ncbi:MAG: glycosyltransferase [Oscillospiraceae bacterium]|nr:glycosyltransferase [Oscillospiraceae bacterium]
MITTIKRIKRAWRQYGFVAMLRMARHRLKSIAAGRSSNATCPIGQLYSELLSKYRKGKICGIAIIPSAFEFDELYNQRTINLAKYLSAKGYGVIYVAWQWHKGETLEKNYQYVYKNVVQMPLYEFVDHHHSFKMFDELTEKKYIIMLPAKILCDLVFFMKESGFDIYYDIMDDWERFHEVGQAPWYIKSIEEAVMLNANKVTAVSEPLVRKFSFLRSDIGLIGNGYYAQLLGDFVQSDAVQRSDDKVVVGYFGHLTESWFDWDLLFGLLDRHDNVRFEIIGYGESEHIRNRAQKVPGIKLLGKVSPRDLHQYVHQWDVAMIPFVKSELSEAVDPIKIYEYLYFGLPTVATGIPHLSEYPYVKVVDNVSELFYQAAMSLYERRLRREVDYKVIADFLEDKTWDKRFDGLLESDFLSELY